MPAVKTKKEPERVDTVERDPNETDVPILGFVEEEPQPEHINVVLYGPPGAGKSTAAASAPGPILWLNSEGPNALAFARKVARDRDVTILEIRLDPRGSSVKQSLEEVYRYVRAGTEPKPATIVVDTLAKLRDALALQIGGQQPTMQQWGKVSDALCGFVNACRDLPVNLILIAHEEVLEDAEAGRIVRPLIGGKKGDQIPSEVDIVAYCRAVRGQDGVEYLGQLVEGRGRYAKDRSGGLGVARALDMTEWLDAFRAALGATPVPWEEDAFDPTELPEEDA